MNVSSIEQISLGVRYVHHDNLNKFILREDYIQVISVFDRRSQNLSDLLMTACTNLGLDISKCIGQGYDRARNMSGHLIGVKGRIRRLFPRAI